MDKTKAKIQELVPEIMKFYVGCSIYVEEKDGEFSYRKPEEHIIQSVSFTEHNDIVPYEIKTCCGTYTPTSRRDGMWKNNMQLGGWDYYGRPITLSDVLLAMKSVENREFADQVSLIAGPKEDSMWDLTKPYDDQSQETKDFIGQILGVK